MNDIRFELPEINTWRLYNKGISQQAVQSMVEAWETHGYRFGTVCIDDGWTAGGKLGDWIPDADRFPDLAGLVEWIHRRGYAVRLWAAPIQIHPGTRIFEKAYPDYVLKNAAGQPAHYTGLGTYRLDPRTTLGAEHIEATLQRLVRDYQVDGFKVDFPPFYEPHDAFYQAAGFSFSEHDNATMVPEFYRLVRQSLDAVRPGIRVECARNLPGCQPYITDTICGDLIGRPRTFQTIADIAAKLKAYGRGYDLVPWLEMVWGEGAESPSLHPDWYVGFLEWIALSINFGLKIEHSFFPFAYPNEWQIRCLTNLYGPRNESVKVLYAGRQAFSVEQMIRAEIRVDAQTRFLVAPEQDVTVVLHTLPLKTNALNWRGRRLPEGTPVSLRARNEFWDGSADWCRVEFEAQKHQVYELWHEGPADEYFTTLSANHVRAQTKT